MFLFIHSFFRACVHSFVCLLICFDCSANTLWYEFCHKHLPYDPIVHPNRNICLSLYLCVRVSYAKYLHIYRSIYTPIPTYGRQKRRKGKRRKNSVIVNLHVEWTSMINFMNEFCRNDLHFISINKAVRNSAENLCSLKIVQKITNFCRAELDR